ncbi:MAG: peptidylprolyl isomerase, partial [Pygmaiobacter sp.]
MLKRTLALMSAAALFAVFFAGCGARERPLPIQSTLPQLAGPQNGDAIAVIDTEMGIIRAVLFPQYAPLAVENFTKLSKNGAYDNLLFHRVVKDFIIQSGDPTGTGTGGESIWGEPFDCEYSDALHNYSGALAMANSGDDINGSQFYIVCTPPDSVGEPLARKMLDSGFAADVVAAYREVGGAPYLDCKYTVFGQVYSGMEVVDAISLVRTENEVPKKEIALHSISIEIYDSAATSAP